MKLMTSAQEPSTEAVAQLPVGRRERGKVDKRSRIHSAAAALFAERGYSAVTTQDIADRADIAIGTLFRYATSKAELLTMVYNAELRDGIDQGLRPGHDPSDPTDRIMRLLSPLLHAGLRQRENMAVYQREILFGDPDGAFRAEALALVGHLEASIAQVLRTLDEAGAGPRLRAGIDVTLAARSIFSVLHMEIIRTGLGRETPADLPDVLRTEIDLLMRGLTAPPAAG
jgi:AcrR family transcriptional regulator